MLFVFEHTLIQRFRRRKSVLYTFSLSVAILVQLSAFGQSTYYVSNAGSDANTGKSRSTPFQSLTKINTLALQPGDSVLFRKGDNFRGTLVIRRSGTANLPLVFDAYGEGENPRITGSVPLTNWTSAGNHIWQASCASCGSAVTGLYQNDVSLPLGRYPNADGANKGNLTISRHTEKYQIFIQETLPGGINWKGAEVVMRPTAWIIDRAVVDQQYGNALNLINNSTYYPADNSEVFFQNHPGTLDRNGEWCYNASTKSILMYDDHKKPADLSIQATVYGRGIDLANVSNISIRNLYITQTLNTSLFAQNVSNLTLSNLEAINTGEDGLIILGSGTDLLLENNKVITAYNNGVWIDFYKNVTFRGNTLKHIGDVPGRGKSGDGQYNGVTSKADLDVLIENNRLDSIGYNGITFWNNTTIRHNVISNYCYSKIDGGGLYCWNGNKAPMGNIHLTSNILYTNPPGNTPWKDYSIGIFLDDCVENVDISNNTIFGNTQWGVFLHGNYNITFTDNTLFDNTTCQLVVYHNSGACPTRNDVITGNTVVSKLPTQLVAQFESNAKDLNQYGRIDSNYYARPFNEVATIRGVVNSVTGSDFSLADWQTFSDGLDSNSKSSPITYKEYKNEGFGGITRINSNFDTTSDDWYVVYSRYNNAIVTRDNNSPLDGGSLRVGFSSLSSQSDTYAQVAKRIGTLKRDKAYVLRFDAVAAANVSILIYLRQAGSPYKEYARRYTIAISPNRKSYELLFTTSADGIDPIVMFQTNGQETTFWLDNVRLQENASIRNNPDDFVKLFYNPTLKDSIVSLTDRYRDVKNQLHTDSITLKPFASLILFKDTLSTQPADLQLSLQSNKRVLNPGDSATIQVRVSNQSNTTASLARWTVRLPANSQFVSAAPILFSDNVLCGTLDQLAPLADTVFTFMVRPTAPGLYRLAAQLTTATSPDPDSTPNSGTADGEDDMAVIDLRVGQSGTTVFESPNPTQRPLLAPLLKQPTPDSGKADLNIRMEMSSRVPRTGDLITCIIYVQNSGSSTANGVQLENRLPDGFELAELGNWIVNGRFLGTTLAPILAGTTVSTILKIKVIKPGTWINKVQISASTSNDPDSVPGNGYVNGEDDTAQVDVRVL
ncbi:hypothetical protein GCM10027592_32390 [Spirosoma flavus]